MPAFTSPISSPEGLRVTRFTAPPTVFLPYREPCGPRSTSTRSRSATSKMPPSTLPMNTPSTYMPTVGSQVGAGLVVTAPRIATVAPVVLLGDAANCTLGTRPFRSCTSVMRCCRSASLPKAEIAIGACCSDCSRFCAVTTISSSPPVWAWAWTPAAQQRGEAYRPRNSFLPHLHHRFP